MPASGASAENFGAIADSENTGSYGYSYDYEHRRGAENRALNECFDTGADDCRVVIWFKNGCGALAIGNDGAGWGWAGGHRRQAEENALNGCYDYTNGCEIVLWVCTTR